MNKNLDKSIKHKRSTSIQELPLTWPLLASSAICFTLAFLLGGLEGLFGTSYTEFMFLAYIPFLLGWIYWLFIVHKLHSILNSCSLKKKGELYKITPNQAVWYHIIPIYGFYWAFRWVTLFSDFINESIGKKIINRYYLGFFYLIIVILGQYFDWILGLILLFLFANILKSKLKLLKANLFPESVRKVIITCPSCHKNFNIEETLERVLLICPFCKEKFEPIQSDQEYELSGIAKAHKLQFFHSIWFVYSMGVLIPYLAIFFIWVSPLFRKLHKLFFTAVFLLYAVFYSTFFYYYFNPEDKSIFIEPISGINLTYMDYEYLGLNKSEHKYSAESIYGYYNEVVVKIRSLNEKGKLISTGSGFFITNDGTLVTNRHVLEGAYRVEVVLWDDRIIKDVKFLKERDNEDLDIAILKVNVKNSSAAIIGKTKELGIGSNVVVIGSPNGLKNTISTGVFSRLHSENGMVYIQTSAPISPGSSGGPLINDDAEVIGITTLQSQEKNVQNINFAIPIEYLIEGKKL